MQRPVWFLPPKLGEFRCDLLRCLVDLRRSAGWDWVRSPDSLNPENIVSAIASAALGNPGKLFPLPLDRQVATDLDRTFYADAGTGGRMVFKGCRRTVGGSRLILPGNLRRCPHDPSWLDATPVHPVRIDMSTHGVEYPRANQAPLSGQTKGALARAPCQALKPIYRPNPADCMDCRDKSDVDAMPCMRSLNSSAFDAFSRAVS
jgi:hypothetical protein